MRTLLLALVLALPLAACSEHRNDDGEAGAPTNRADGDDAIAYREPSSKDRWTLVVLPDTQDYSELAPEILEAQVDWILEQESALDIRMVVHVGDLVDDDVPEQWQAASAALGRLAGRVPLLFVPGNHDFAVATRRESMLERYLDPADFRATHRGDSYDARGWNSYQIMKSPTREWLFLGLEFAPRREVIQWAADVLREHADLEAVVVTHLYLYSDGTRYDFARYGHAQLWNPYIYAVDPQDKLDGEGLWQELLRAQPRLRFVLCGHTLNDGIGRLSSTGDAGNRVHQVLANYQLLVDQHVMPSGLDGFLRVMTFSEGDTQVAIRTYSPFLDLELSDEQNRFAYELEL